MDIHVTQIGQCNRKWWHQLVGHQKLPSHYLAVKGILTHRIIERCLKDGAKNVDVTYPKLLEGRKHEDDIGEVMYNTSLMDAKQHVDNFIRWVADTKHNLPDFTTEDELMADYEGYWVVGTPDLYNDRIIIDFKTGKPVLRGKYVEQVGGYAWLLKRVKGISIQEAEVVFFGADKPVTKTVPNNKLVEGQVEWMRKLNEDIITINTMLDKINDGYTTPPLGDCTFDIGCAFCGWRDRCNGI